MARVIGVGNQNFENIITNRYFYIDKTAFLKEWWENGDTVTLITRPRRFGKTLNLSMVETFFPPNMPAEATCLKGCPYGRKNVIGNFREPVR